MPACEVYKMSFRSKNGLELWEIYVVVIIQPRDGQKKRHQFSTSQIILETVKPPVHFEFRPRVSSGSKIAFVHSPLKPRSDGDRLYRNNAPLYQRGWVFQEIELSPRSIHFRERQMYWRCAVGLRSEDGTLDQSPENHRHLNSLDQTIRGKNELSKSLRLHEI